MQNIQVIGRIVRDAERKVIGEGNKSVFTIVTTNGRRKDGENRISLGLFASPN